MNAHYKQLACERAVLLALVRIARERFLPLEGMDEPEVRIESEELPRNECIVPEDTVIEVVMRIQRLAVSMEKEMGTFAHVRAENSYEKEWQKDSAQAGAAHPPTQGGKGKGKNRNRGK